MKSGDIFLYLVSFLIFPNNLHLKFQSYKTLQNCYNLLFRLMNCYNEHICSICGWIDGWSEGGMDGWYGEFEITTNSM